MQPTQYRIVVRGRLTDRLASAFTGMTWRVIEGDTALVGEIQDQSHLYGVLENVRALGLELVSAAPEHPRRTPAQATH